MRTGGTRQSTWPVVARAGVHRSHHKEIFKHTSLALGEKERKGKLLSSVLYGVVRKVAVERRTDRAKLDNVIIIRGRLRCYSVEEAGVHELLQEELDVSQLRVLDAERLQHAKVTILDCHEHGAQVFQV
jgi:hypothetical protein